MNCEKATRLMSEARERPLSLQEKLSLGVHKTLCSGCRQFDRQMVFLHRAARQQGHADDQSSDQQERGSGD